MNKTAERPNRQHNPGNKKPPSRPAAQESMSDRKITIIQNTMVLIAFLLGATQTGLARGFGAMLGSMTGYPQAEGWIDSTIFFAPYLCVLFVYFMLDFMKKK